MHSHSRQGWFQRPVGVSSVANEEVAAVVEDIPRKECPTVPVEAVLLLIQGDHGSL